MRNITVLWAGCLIGVLIALAVVATASAQVVYAPPVDGVYGSVAYPYGHPYVPHHAYRKAVRFGFVPVAPPPTLFRGPTDCFGRPFYGPPYYAYPRPPLGYPGYAGTSGGPSNYLDLIPPPIPVVPDSQTGSQQPTAAPEPAPTPPPRPAEPIPTPPIELDP